EYKVMGLAPYGEPKHAGRIFRELVDLKDDGSFKLNLDYFDFCAGLTMTNARFDALFGGPPRAPESPLTPREMDLAASVQRVTEEVMLRMARHARTETGLPDLCLAGGVALNCVGNGRIHRERVFDRLWIQPAAGDAGGALGAALTAWHHYLDKPRRAGALDSQHGSRLGPEYSDAEIESCLKGAGADYRRLDRSDLLDAAAVALAAGKVVGWFQGRMEYGPRALGARSILGDPRDPRMQTTMNVKIKRRESFRPFAPAVLRERCSEYFELDADSPYMLLTAPVRAARRRPETEEERRLFGIERLKVARSEIPAVTHVDYSARVQTVSRADDPLFRDLLEAFDRKTGCPVLVNTSFNVRGEPIVCSPREAFACFMRTEMDCLAIGGFFLEKAGQRPWRDDPQWERRLVLD
ncbi:MAG: hypothetical protein HY553_23160, partial [Elusimicrobia bacterium]|nr:hypothetical protein [Elusimicrobiota bacterium]